MNIVDLVAKFATENATVRGPKINVAYGRKNGSYTTDSIVVLKPKICNYDTEK